MTAYIHYYLWPCFVQFYFTFIWHETLDHHQLNVGLTLSWRWPTIEPSLGSHLANIKSTTFHSWRLWFTSLYGEKNMWFVYHTTIWRKPHIQVVLYIKLNTFFSKITVQHVDLRIEYKNTSLDYREHKFLITLYFTTANHLTNIPTYKNKRSTKRLHALSEGVNLSDSVVLASHAFPTLTKNFIAVSLESHHKISQIGINIIIFGTKT